MVVHPLLEEKVQNSSSLISSLGLPGSEANQVDTNQTEIPRKLDIYAASSGYDLRDELDFLSKRTIEANIFFNARFLAPAMPRLEDGTICFMVMRDENDVRSRLRFVMPYTVERFGWSADHMMLRSWTTSFSPQGTPLIDQDDPEGVVDDLFDILERKHLNMPQVITFPDMRKNGAVACVIRDVAKKRNLPIVSLDTKSRAFLRSDMSGDAYLNQALTLTEKDRLNKSSSDLSELGVVKYEVATDIEEIRFKFERYVALENRTVKVKNKAKIVGDRYREAFAREAVNNLAERGAVEFHTLSLNDKIIATAIVFVENGDAWIWKCAYAEKLRALSPDTLLLREVIKHSLDSTNIDRLDACILSENPLVKTVFNIEEPQETLIVGLNQNAGKLVGQAAKRLKLSNRGNALSEALRKSFYFLKRT